jgi:hypothetical protein
VKRASYRDAIDFVAQNDSAECADAFDEEAVSFLVTAVMVAELFGVPPAKVSRDIVARRRKVFPEHYARLAGK